MHRIHRNAYLLLALTLPSLAGCGVPESVMLVSYAANGVSYVATGKSVLDHAVSVAADRNCAMLRAVRDEDVCRDAAPGPRDLRRNGDDAAQLAQAGASDESSAPRPGQIWMLVLGSYPDLETADSEMRRYRAFDPFLATEAVDGREHRRVVAGPYAESELQMVRSLARQAGATDVRLAPLCSFDTRAARCVARETASIPPPQPRS